MVCIIQFTRPPLLYEISPFLPPTYDFAEVSARNSFFHCLKCNEYRNIYQYVRYLLITRTILAALDNQQVQ